MDFVCSEYSSQGSALIPAGADKLELAYTTIDTFRRLVDEYAYPYLKNNNEREKDAEYDRHLRDGMLEIIKLLERGHTVGPYLTGWEPCLVRASACRAKIACQGSFNSIT